MNDTNAVRQCRWFWCDLHNQPVVSMDPAGDPWCWLGHLRGELDDCTDHLTLVHLTAVPAGIGGDDE